MTIREAKALLISHVRAGEPVILRGAPGVGKSDLVNQVAAEVFGAGKCIEYIASIRDTVDLRGIPVADAESGITKWLPPSELPREDRDGPGGILFLDEINAAGPAMQAACYGLVLNRRVADYVLPGGWVPVAAGNLQSDRAVTNRMSSALANRFAHTTIVPDVESWQLWAAEYGVHEYVRAFIAFKGVSALHKMPAADAEPAAFPTPRSWARAARVIRANGPAADLRGIVTANVGQDMAGEFMAFANAYSELAGLIPEIEADPATARLPSPDNPSVAWSVAVRLADMATLGNWGRLATYLARLPREFDILATTTAVRRLPALRSHAATTAFQVRHQNVTF